MLEYLIICPMVFLAGFVDAIAGGGGLISLPAYALAGLPLHTAVATNKMSSTMGTAVASVQYARRGFVAWKIAPFGVVFALLGSALGANLALKTEDTVFRLLLLCMLPFTAFHVLRKKRFDEEKEEYPFRKACPVASAVAFSVGLYDGFYGPGTGTFLILLLTGIGHMRLKRANGLTKIINLASNAAALAVYLVNGQVLLTLGVTAGVFNTAGNYLGARCFEKNSAGFAKPAVLTVLAIFWIKLIWETLI